MALNLIARLGLDGKGFQAGLARANRQTGQFASGIKRQFVGMFGVAAIGIAIKKATDYADEINNLSRRLGVSTKALQEFNYAANLSGSDLKTVATSLQRVQEAQERLKNGNKQAEDSFRRLGFAFDDALQVNPAEVFRRAGELYANQALSPEMFGDIRTLFGAEAGPRNIRIFTEDLAAMAEQARESGAVLSNEQIQTAADLKDTMAVLKMAFLGPFGEALAILGKAALDASAHFNAFLVGFQAWRIKNQDKSLWDLLTGKGIGEGSVRMKPTTEMIREQMTANLQGQGLEDWQIKKRVGISMSRAENTGGWMETEDYKKAYNQLIGKMEGPSIFRDTYETVLKEQLEENERKLEQQSNLRKLMTSTAGMDSSAIARKSATKIETDALAKMGLFIGGRGNPLINAAEKQVEEIRGVKREVETLNQQVKKKL